jgi:methylmalonyl-CoA/ethylmalonyl-CoA epimerase
MFKGIHHVAVVVRDIEKALGFYRDILGLPVGQRATVADQGVQAALLLAGPDEIELLEPTNPAGGVARFLDKKGEGIHHLCVATTDVAAALERIKAANLPVIDQAPRQGLAGTIAFLHPAACQGVLLEMAQPGEAAHSHRGHGDGIGAVGIKTFYLGSKDPKAAAEALAAHFDAAIQGPDRDPHFSSAQMVARIGASRMTILDAGELAASPEVSRFLGGKSEGLLGLCLAVADFDAAVAHLGRQGVPVEVRQAGASVPLAKVAVERTHGVGLFLCPAGC